MLLHVFRRRSARRRPAELLAQLERSRMLQPGTADPRAVLEIERTAFACAAPFEAVALAPVAPLGINRVLGGIDQNSCLATVRGAEVLADPTTAMALECARRRRAGEGGTLRLCSRSRQLRLQPFDNPAFSPHFDLFALASAGRDRGGLAFEMESLREHVEVYLGLLARLTTEGYEFEGVTVSLADTERDESRLLKARSEVIEPLAERFPGVDLRLDPAREQGRGYYAGLCLSLDATDPTGQRWNLADGGFTDWTRRLLANAKERLLTSGIGIELIARRFLRPA